MLVVYSYYVLDIVHEGHLLMMRNAKAIAGKDGKFIAGILTDEAVMEKKPPPILPFPERLALAEAIQYVDVAVAQDQYSPLANVLQIRPDILLESTSHLPEAIAEAKKCMDNIGGRLIVLPYYPEQSSTSIKNAIKESANESTADE